MMCESSLIEPQSLLWEDGGVSEPVFLLWKEVIYLFIFLSSLKELSGPETPTRSGGSMSHTSLWHIFISRCTLLLLTLITSSFITRSGSSAGDLLHTYLPFTRSPLCRPYCSFVLWFWRGYKRKQKNESLFISQVLFPLWVWFWTFYTYTFIYSTCSNRWSWRRHLSCFCVVVVVISCAAACEQQLERPAPVRHRLLWRNRYTCEGFFFKEHTGSCKSRRGTPSK